MRYYSTNKNSPAVDFKEAAVRGQAPDKGLYFPETIPQVEEALIEHIESLSEEEIAFRVIRPYAGNVIEENDLLQIVRETVNFPIPLVKINDAISSLELFHGPTLAFKDVGARFMSRCLSYFLQSGSLSSPRGRIKGGVTVLVATSGDTGGAVASGFYDVEGIEVVILYPSEKVSPVQEKQLTTLGKNIHALEVKGSFDDCQQMVKQAFMDKEVNDKKFLTSANSINVARWLPQQFYYFFAWKQWKDKKNPPVISVPSGNFGNICAGMLAMKSGLPVKHFIAACNSNDAVTKYLQALEDTGFKPQKAVPTLSNAMDVGNPSNFVRIQELFNRQFPELKKHLSSYSITDKETISTIGSVYEQYKYLLDPHGAVGYLALEKYAEKQAGAKGFFLETAHPVKFPDVVEEAIGQSIEMPGNVAELSHREKKSLIIDASYEQLKEYLFQ